MSDPVELVLARLRQAGCKVQKAGPDQWLAQCPAEGHTDRNPSLSVGRGTDGRALVSCHRGDAADQIVAGLGLEMGDLFAEPRDGNRTMVIAEHPYHDENGEVVFVVERRSGGQYLQKRPNPRGAGWVYSLDGVKREVYRLPKVLDAVSAGETIYIVEGEKCVEALEQQGLIATTNSQGAGSWKDEYSTRLQGASVVILPDHDEAGRKHGQQVARSVWPEAKSLKLVELPGLDEKGDIYDWFKAGRTVDELAGLIDDTPEWTPLVEGLAEVLDDTRRFLKNYLVFANRHQAVTVALWIVHCWLIDSFEVTPLLAVTSAEPESGKTVLLEAVQLLVPKPMMTSNMTPAVLFRKIERDCPTVLFDEADSVFHRKSGEKAEEIRGILDAGHRRGNPVFRIVGEGKNLEPKAFDTFAPKAIAAIGELPETIASRAIEIRMIRKRTDEPVERFRRRVVGPIAAGLRHRIETVTKGLDLSDVWPEIPDVLGSRAGDGWEPLFAAADAAGGEWPKLARDASIELSTTETQREPTRAHMLLSDIRAIFEDRGADRIRTEDLLDELNKLAASPWSDYRGGKGLNAHGVARLLRPYDIKAKKVNFGGEKRYQGFTRNQFDDVWKRYLPSTPLGSGSELELRNSLDV